MSIDHWSGDRHKFLLIQHELWQTNINVVKYVFIKILVTLTWIFFSILVNEIGILISS